MSYDVWLEIDTGGDCSAAVTERRNPTCNYAAMFHEALGCPFRNLDGWVAEEVVEWLHNAISDMKARPEAYQALENPEWGSYGGGIDVLETLVAECERHPKATVRVT